MNYPSLRPPDERVAPVQVGALLDRPRPDTFLSRFSRSLWNRHGAHLVGVAAGIAFGTATASPFVVLGALASNPSLAFAAWVAAVVVGTVASITATQVTIPAACDAIHGPGAWDGTETETKEYR